MDTASRIQANNVTYLNTTKDFCHAGGSFPSAFDGQDAVEPAALLSLEMNDFGGDDDFLDAIESAADRAGCEFLFEIPAALIDEEGSKAAALRFEDRDQPIYCFVVASAQAGNIKVIQDCEVDQAVYDFVHSYSHVLSLMGDLTAPGSEYMN